MLNIKTLTKTEVKTATANKFVVLFGILFSIIFVISGLFAVYSALFRGNSFTLANASEIRITEPSGEQAREYIDSIDFEIVHE